MPSIELTPINLVLGFLLLCASPIMLVTLPFLLGPLLSAYALYYLFWPVTPKKSPLRSKEVGTAKPGETAPRRWAAHTELVTKWDNIETIPALIAQSVERFGSRPALGARRIIKVEEKKKKETVDGKEVEKTLKTPWLSDYEWRTYTQMWDEIKRFGAGLLTFELQQGQRIALFAATRPEWQIAAQGCFAQGLPVVTAYPSLGVEALAFSLNQAHVQHIITQADKLDLVIQTASTVTSLKYVIFFDELSNAKRAEYEAKSRLKFISYAQVLMAGTGHPSSRQLAAVKGSDIAVIMYTSGSTGNPKGVLITHQNLLSAGYGVTFVPPEPLNHEDTYIAFLPLAHVLELAAETTFLAVGARIGYGSPLTLNDNGAKDADGKPAGDLSKLRPTIMAAVPLILDRLKAAVNDQVAKSNIVARTVFRVAFYLKHRNWQRKQSSPILDKLVFSKIAAKMGGRVRLLLSGGAPLSKDTQAFINVVFCVPVLQGYGLTETLAANCICHPDDVQPGNVGAPIPSCEIKLVDVPEMGYHSTDKDKDGKPAPRGEIVIRGGCVAPGYFDLPQQTAEVFEKGKGKGDDALSWFHSGDIGQWREDGTLAVIDRKKDLVKLAHGEYIALGNLESVYAHSPLVSNICIYADADHQRPIAIIVPNKGALAGVAHTASTSGDALQSAAVKDAVLADLNKYAAQKRLEKWERIAAVYLTDDDWTPQSGLLTEAMKLKRHEIKKKYAKQIQETYSQVQ